MGFQVKAHNALVGLEGRAALLRRLGGVGLDRPGALFDAIEKDGDTVNSPFLVQFGLSGMGVAPAGVEKPNTGHHHLLIDTTMTAEQMKEPIPADDTHKHFGGGQTEAMVTLPEGKHTLQLLLADWTHIPHVPPVMSEPITITVR